MAALQQAAGGRLPGDAASCRRYLCEQGLPPSLLGEGTEGNRGPGPWAWPLLAATFFLTAQAAAGTRTCGPTSLSRPPGPFSPERGGSAPANEDAACWQVEGTEGGGAGGGSSHGAGGAGAGGGAGCAAAGPAGEQRPRPRRAPVAAAGPQAGEPGRAGGGGGRGGRREPAASRAAGP